MVVCNEGIVRSILFTQSPRTAMVMKQLGGGPLSYDQLVKLYQHTVKVNAKDPDAPWEAFPEPTTTLADYCFSFELYSSIDVPDHRRARLRACVSSVHISAPTQLRGAPMSSLRPPHGRTPAN